MIAIVAAMDRQRVIGRDNLIPWRLPADLRRLKQLTAGKTVILGRKTYDSMAGYYQRSGRPMPGETYIVITRNSGYPAGPRTRLASSLQQALEQASELGRDAYVIGGGEIFRQILSQADRLYITEVQAEVPGDSYFPEIDTAVWREASREHHHKDDKNDYDFDFITYDRI